MNCLHHWQPRNWAEARITFAPDGDDGGGTPKPTPSGLLSQYNGDAVRMAEKLAEVLIDNAAIREQRRTLREEVTTLKAKQVPEGAVILQGEDAAAYEAYKPLGKPADLTKRLADADAATQRLTTLERDAVIRDAATAAGYKFSVLRDRAADLPIEVREVDQDGKKVSRAFVKPQGGGEHELTAYAQQHWGDYLPALTAAQADGNGNGQGQQQGQGLAFPRQQGGGGTGARSLTDDFIAQRNEAASKAPNPLAPPAPAAAAR